MAQHKRDYYEVLGVGKSVSADDLKKAYRQAAMKHHPDRNPGDKKAEEKFKEATEAYQVLADPQKRKLYDQFGHEGVSGAAGAGFGGFSGAGFSDIFEGIFEDFFSGGGSGRRNRPERGSDLQYGLEISFMEAAFGLEKKIEIQREENCGTCKGDGAKPGHSRTTCSACHGTGQTMASSGFFSIARTCGRCHGRGSFIEHPCTDCRGSGRVTVDRKVQIKIPAGTENGMRLRISGEGEAGHREGPRGDLYIDVSVAPHEIFSREENNVVCQVPVSMVCATLGGEIDVPTLAGSTKLKIPAGTQSGKIFRLKGKGIASLRGHGLGDQEVHVVVETPTHLSEKQKELLNQFAALSGEKVSPIAASFSETVKKLFSSK